MDSLNDDESEFSKDIMAIWLYVDEKIKQLNEASEGRKREKDKKIASLENQISQLYSILADCRMIPSETVEKNESPEKPSQAELDKEAQQALQKFIRSQDTIKVLYVDGFEGIRLFRDLKKVEKDLSLENIEIRYQNDKIVLSKVG